MVVKKRVGQQFDFNDKFVLPLVNEFEDTQPKKPLMGQKRPLHERHIETVTEPLRVPFWRRWGSKQCQEPVLPSWANPQEDYVMSAPMPGKNTIVFTAKRKSSTWSFLMFGFLVAGLLTYWHLTVSLQMILTETEAMMAVRNQINIKLRSAEKDVRMLSREVAATEAIFQKRKDEKAQLQAREAAAAIADKEKAEKSLVDAQQHVSSGNHQTVSLRETVQRYSRQTVLSKYGDGRHLVEVDLEFPDGDEGPSSFVMELAPLEKMPHSVHVFLDMVSNQLWDGCSFVMNAMHVIKAAPLPYNDASGTEKARAFVEKGLNGPSFKEYTSEYPHKRYTVGFAGGNSPSFYINTEDNTEIHAGDSAFGRIISGFEAVKRLEASPTQNGIWFRDRIGIKRVALL
mmetsp:Transcript_3580/g.6098  ORF Transcript_3580/g.6098 Transcript_3580/m.6098 type:complete len:399 (-) Transcript_3580:119-1315(-)